MAVSSVSHAVYVNDDYLGWDGFIGPNDEDTTGGIKFDISGMDYTNDGTSVTFTLRSPDASGLGYFDAWQKDTTNFQPGDLFLSTDGWTPFDDGSPGFGSDSTANGEDWEYVIDLGDIDTFNNQLSGGAQLYSIADGGVIEGGSIRSVQEATYDPDDFFNPNTNPLGAGSWLVFDEDTDGTFDSMSITMLLSDGFQGVLDEADANGQGLGFHWTMSCGNDTIEGVVPVPAAVWLFGSGLLGLVGFARRRNKV
jgi:hypothetical protein